MSNEGFIRVCPVAERCGACQNINVPYAEQLAAKDAYVKELFSGIVDASAIQPILGMDDPYHYRNKVASPFAPKKGRRNAKGKKCDILTGMYAPHSHQLVDTCGCLVENKAANQVVQAIRSIMLKHGMQPYDEDTGQGFSRHTVIRVGHASEEMLVTIVTNGEEFPSSKAFCRELVKRCPAITTVVQNVNTSSTNVILGQQERTLYGPGFILDTLCGLSFRISSQSFYQVNAVQTEVLYETAMTFAKLQAAHTVIDAYCGTGTIGLVAAKRSGAQVVGVDSVESAIADARQNARHNGIENAQFIVADATQFMREQAAVGGKADLLFMDPPRAGSTPEFLDALAMLAPSRVVYISCNPQTQVRDLAYLTQRGYALDAVQPVDMFPHTKHVETVAMLRR
ncbi:MAG: 23S rRNA (uracil(1939)-C(5))-methyltransferase RlmD [Eggerthellaceae bacterium]|nr:23S rRNA (uracil(1939)-C(5))-methyltransferase RlmD [Eggerthellaceae bacterium]